MFTNLLFGTNVSRLPTSMTTANTMIHTKMAYSMYCVMPNPVSPNGMTNPALNDSLSSGTAALSIALSFVLSCLRLFRMPTHGAVTPGSMLPIMLFSLVYGIGPGMIAGLVYGLLQCTQGITFIAGIQFLFDYILAFAMLGLAGLCSGKKDSLGRLMLCLFIAAFCRFLCHTVAGMYWYFGEYETGESFLVKLWASVVYNGSYMLPDLVICLLLAIPVLKPVFRIMKG